MVQSITEDRSGIEVHDGFPSIQDIKTIFQNHGFNVGQALAAGSKCDGEGNVVLDWHVITFRGDIPNEGLRAFDVAVEHGLIPASPLTLEWNCRVHWQTGEGTIDDEPIWVMEFQTAEYKGTYRNIRCFCFV